MGEKDHKNEISLLLSLLVCVRFLSAVQEECGFFTFERRGGGGKTESGELSARQQQQQQQVGKKIS